MAEKIYTKQYAGQLEDIFAKRARFIRAFGGQIQTILGAEVQKDFLEIKIEDTETVIQEYSTDPNVAFGEGTADSNRFGPRREVKSVDKQVPFDQPLAIHEGVDRFTVNDEYEAVVAKKLATNAASWVTHYDKVLGDALAELASETLTGELTEAGVIKLFNEANTTFVDNEVSEAKNWLAFVTPEVYNIIVDSKLSTLLKGSDVNVDKNEIYEFKGFLIERVPSHNMQNSAYFTVEGVGVAGVGIEVARTIPSEAFNGDALQAAGKLGKYIPEGNSKAILVADLTEVDELPEG